MEALAIRRSARGLGNEIEQRVTDEFDRDTGLAIERFFEREDDQHLLNESFQHFYTTGPAGPDLGTDEVERGNPAVLRERQHATVEAVVVHADHRVWPAGSDEVPKTSCKHQQKTNLERRLPETGHAARGKVLDEFVRGGAARCATDGSHTNVRRLALECPDQTGGMKIPGRVAGDDEKETADHRNWQRCYTNDRSFSSRSAPRPRYHRGNANERLPLNSLEPGRMHTLCRLTIVVLGSLASLSAWSCRSAAPSVVATGTRMPNPTGCYLQVWDQPESAGNAEFINGPVKHIHLNNLPGPPHVEQSDSEFAARSGRQRDGLGRRKLPGEEHAPHRGGLQTASRGILRDDRIAGNHLFGTKGAAGKSVIGDYRTFRPFTRVAVAGSLRSCRQVG